MVEEGTASTDLAAEFGFIRPGHRTKLQPRATLGQFLGFERPFGGGIFRVLLDDGRVSQSQTVEFSDMPGAISVQIPLPLSQIWRAGEREGKDDDDTSVMTMSQELRILQTLQREGQQEICRPKCRQCHSAQW
jgi:hypothetical protein